MCIRDRGGGADVPPEGTLPEREGNAKLEEVHAVEPAVSEQRRTREEATRSDEEPRERDPRADDPRGRDETNARASTAPRRVYIDAKPRTAYTYPGSTIRPLGSIRARSRDAFAASVPEPLLRTCLLYTSPSPRDATLSRMPSSA